MRVSRRFTAFCVSLSDTTRHGPAPEGMAGLRHKQRHKTTQGSGPPMVPSSRIAEPPVRQRGKAACFDQTFWTPHLGIDGCNLIREHRRQAVEGQSPSTCPAASLSAPGNPLDGPAALQSLQQFRERCSESGGDLAQSAQPRFAGSSLQVGDVDLVDA